jgi:hypothetical protein
MTVTPADLRQATDLLRSTLAPSMSADWSLPAGDLEWPCARTLEHVANATTRYALHLASRAAGPLPPPRRHDPDLSVDDLLALASASAATLAEVAAAAGPEARGYHPAGMADAEGFLAMGCDEILVHGHDIATGLGTGITVPGDLCTRVVARLFPWAPDDTDPWATLLWANGRAALGDRPRLDPDWHWWCAPLAEWDGARKRRTNPPSW